MLATLHFVVAQINVDAVPNNIKSFFLSLFGAILVVVVGWRLVKAVIAGSTGAVVGVVFLAGLAYFTLNNVEIIGNLFGALLRRFGIA